MKTKLLTTAVALALATVMTPVFSQGSGGGSSDGGGRQSVGASGTADKGGPPTGMNSGDTPKKTTSKRKAHSAQVLPNDAVKTANTDYNNTMREARTKRDKAMLDAREMDRKEMEKPVNNR